MFIQSFSDIELILDLILPMNVFLPLTITIDKSYVLLSEPLFTIYFFEQKMDLLRCKGVVRYP